LILGGTKNMDFIRPWADGLDRKTFNLSNSISQNAC
jgi:hypothetical protein